MKTELKNQIESYFEQENFEEVSGLLHKYKEQYPSDRDLWFYECVLALTVGELEKAQKIADKCVHKLQQVMRHIIIRRVSIRQGE